MLIESMKISIEKKDAIRYASNKMPLMSRVVQFNTMAKNIKVEYIEYKILKYEISSKPKGNILHRKAKDTHTLTMLVNTYDGYSESIEEIPYTETKYISKNCIKGKKITDEDIIKGVKNQVIKFLKNKHKKDQNINIQDINIKELRSIYKPCWVVNFKGKSVFIDI